MAPLTSASSGPEIVLVKETVRPLARRVQTVSPVAMTPDGIGGALDGLAAVGELPCWVTCAVVVSVCVTGSRRSTRHATAASTTTTAAPSAA